MASEGIGNEAFLNKVVDTICRLGLRTPALLALESGHPLTFIGGQLLWIAQPALSLMIPRETVDQTARLLEEPDAIEALIARLEARTAP